MKSTLSLPAFALLAALSQSAGAGSLQLRDHETGQVITGASISLVCDASGKTGWIIFDKKITVVNTSSKEMEIGAKKIELNELQPDVSHSFCFAGYCFPSFTFVSPVYETLPAGASDSALDGEFKGSYNYDNSVHVPGVDRMAYVFFDANNPSDSAIVFVDYVTANVGISKAHRSNRYFSAFRFNSALGQVDFRLNGFASQPGPLSFSLAGAFGGNIRLGKIIREQDKITVVTGKLPTGIYFLSVTSGNRMLGLERLLVSP